MSSEKQKLRLKRNVISLEDKIKILDKLKEGVKIVSVARSLNLNEATIRTIKKNEEKIRNVSAKCSAISKLTGCAKDLNIVKMEESLATGTEGCSSKRRNVISLEDKIKILDTLKQGVKIASVARSLNLNEATIRTIKKNEEKIRNNVSAGYSTISKRTECAKDLNIVKMEESLATWIEDCSSKRIALDGNIIRQKALKIYNCLKEKEQCYTQNQQNSFSASKGWLENFKKRYSLSNCRHHGESISIDAEAASKFTLELQEIIENERYTPDQIFNADETGLNWKQMPSRTYISKNQKTVSGFEIAKERVTILMCSNASGDLMLKPLVINRSFTPKAMKNCDKSQLPVHWRANKKADMTSDLFRDWFHNCFLPEVKHYMQGKYLRFKVLLILDNSPVHPKDLFHPNVKVLFLPPNTKSIIQPLDQGVISTFKTNYVRNLFESILIKAEYKENKTITQRCNEFSIMDCVNSIYFSLSELKSSTLNASWKALLPQIVQKENSVPSSGTERILDIAHTLGGEGFEDMCDEDLEELFRDQPTFTEGDVIELISDYDSDIISDDTYDSSEESKSFSIENIRKGLDLAKQLEFHFLQNDPSMSRRIAFKRNLTKCLSPYRKLYKTLENKETHFCSANDTNNQNFSCAENLLCIQRKRIRLLDDDSDEE